MLLHIVVFMKPQGMQHIFFISQKHLQPATFPDAQDSQLLSFFFAGFAANEMWH